MISLHYCKDAIYEPIGWFRPPKFVGWNIGVISICADEISRIVDTKSGNLNSTVYLKCREGYDQISYWVEETRSQILKMIEEANGKS